MSLMTAPSYAGISILTSQGDQSEETTTVRARRRRPSGASQPGTRERAEAPRRRRDGSSGGQVPPAGQPPLGGGGGASSWPRPGGGAGQLPGGLPPIFGGRMSPPMLILLAVVACVFLCAVLFLFRGGGPELGGISSELPAEPALPTPTEPTLQVPTVEPAAQPGPTATRRSFTPPAVSGEGQKWLVMLYQDADDKVLERDIYVDLNEAERVGSSDRVRIVAQTDRFSGGYAGDGDWVGAKRFYVTQDEDLEQVGSQEIADLGEVNMADGETLVDFASWAVATFPADRYVLILSDHGMGWPGGWTDPAPGGRGRDNIALAEMGDQLFLMELDRALDQIRSQTGLDKLELIGLDACLMGHLEVMSALAPYARYAVTSQETEPALGWAYAAFLGDLQQNPDMDGAELGRRIVESYIQEDERIVDDQARADLLRGGSPLGGFGLYQPNAAQLAQQMSTDVTLAAVNLAAMPELTASLNDLAYALSQVDQSRVARARTYAQSFTSVFGRNVPPSYVDLGNLAQLLKSSIGGSAVSQAADRVLAGLQETVIAEKKGQNKPGATGLSVYFPNSELYRTRFAGPESYTTVARRFAAESLWDDFLAYHYTGRRFEPTAGQVAVPDRGATITGPGAGEIQVAPVSLSADTAAPGQPVVLSTEIRGENLGYIYLYVGYLDQAANSVFVADKDYLETDNTREVGGVYYPDWGDTGVLALEFEWEPIVYAIDDGTKAVLALLTPRDYGASPDTAVYSVDGTYAFADGSEPRYARLLFSDGRLTQVFGFTGQEAIGAPREITPQPGDTFTIQEQWIDLGGSGGAVEYASQEGETLTFSDQPWTWVEQDAPVGQYVVGFIVEDLDGNEYQTFEMVNVE